VRREGVEDGLIEGRGIQEKEKRFALLQAKRSCRSQEENHPGVERRKTVKKNYGGKEVS